MPGVLEGEQLQPSELARLCHKYWRDIELVRAVAVCLAESQGYTRAKNTNENPPGKVLSKDLGIFQINVEPDENEERFYDPVYNIYRAYQLYRRRKWQPWAAFNSGIALDPAWWRWSDKKQDWVKTGRYVQRAVRGVSNFYASKLGLDIPLLDYYNVPSKPTGDK